MEKIKYKKRIISEKQKKILLLLYIFRFLSSRQIQEFLKHKDHRRINSWLKDLDEKGYVVKEFKPIFGTLTKPAVCYLSITGRSYIKSSYNYYFPKYLKKISRDNKASKSFRIRCQLIADWYLMLFPNTEKDGKENNKIKSEVGVDIIDYLEIILTNGSKNHKDSTPLNKLQFFTSAYFSSFILLDKIKPDAYLRKRTTKGIAHGLLFVLDAYIPRFLLRYKIQGIFEKLNEENWEDNSMHSLNIYFLCPNNIIITYCRRLLPSFLEKYYGSKPLEFRFATRNQLYKRKSGKTKEVGWITFSSTDY